MREPDRPEKVHRDQSLPERVVIGHERLDPIEARRVDEDGGWTVHGHDGIAQCAHRLLVGQIDHVRGGVRAVVHRPDEPCLIAVDGGHGRAGLRQRDRDGPTDPRGRTRDHSDFVVESHYLTFRSAVMWTLRPLSDARTRKSTIRSIIDFNGRKP